MKYTFIKLLTIFFLVSIFSPVTIAADSLKNLNKNSLQIDTGNQQKKEQISIDTVKKVHPNQIYIDSIARLDSINAQLIKEKTLTNTKLFIYILLSIGGMALFFYIFVLVLFRTFHKSRSTRQSLMLSWNLFFTVSVIWIFIVWGTIAGFWAASAFVILMVFLFIISLITLIISIKSK